MKTVHEFSAGGVALTRDPVQVALVKVRANDGEGRWVLPKGLAEPGEAVAETAGREVREETGFEVDVGERTGDIEYWFVMHGVRHHKKVTFFAMWITGGDPSLHDHEVEEVGLFDPADAIGVMSYDSERDIVAKALAAAEVR